MGGANPLNFEDVIRDSRNDRGNWRDFEMDLLNARLAASGLDLTGATAPSINVTGSLARIRWAAAAVAGIAWSFKLRGEWCQRQGSNVPKDEIRFNLTALNGAGASSFSPVLRGLRPGVGAIGPFTPTAVKVASTVAAMDAAGETAGVSFALTNGAAQAEEVLVIFRGNALQAGDCLQFELTPTAGLGAQVDLFGVIRRELTHPALRNRAIRRS